MQVKEVKMKKLSLLISILLVLFLFSSCNKNKPYIIVTDDSFSPFCYKESTGEAAGFDIEIIKAIAKDQNLNIEIRAIGLLESLDAVENDQADAAIAAIIPTDEFYEKFDFSNMYYKEEYAVAVKKGCNAELLEKINNGLTNIIENGKYEEILKEYVYIQ